MTVPTGPDFLMTVASRAADRGQPYASEFAIMVDSAFAPPPVTAMPGMEWMGQLPTEMMATRPLQEHEASPVSIILGAFEAAKVEGDAEAQMEVLRVGLTLLAKWPDYLLMTTTGHPTLMFKPSDREAGVGAGDSLDAEDANPVSKRDQLQRTYAESVERARRPESELTREEELRRAGLDKLADVVERIEKDRSSELDEGPLDTTPGPPPSSHRDLWCPIEEKSFLPDTYATTCPLCEAPLTWGEGSG